MKSLVGGLFLGERNLHGVGRRNLKALQRFAGTSRLDFVLEFDERNVVTSRNETDLLESRESVQEKIALLYGMK